MVRTRVRPLITWKLSQVFVTHLDRASATKNSINGNYTVTHPSLFFPRRYFPNPSRDLPTQLPTRTQLQVYSCVQKRGASEGESLPESLRKVPFGVVETDQSSRPPFIPFLPLSLLPRFFQTIAKMGLAFNARRKVLRIGRGIRGCIPTG